MIHYIHLYGLMTEISFKIFYHQNKSVYLYEM